MSTNRTGRGFTLVELLVVIAIIAVLAAILFPVFTKAREKANQTTCINNQRQIMASVLMYAQDHDEELPPAEGFWSLINVSGGVLTCPTVAREVSNGYGCNVSLTGRSLGDITNPVSALLIADCRKASDVPNTLTTGGDLDLRHSKKAVAGYVDGHIELVSAAAGIGKLPVTDGLFAWYTGGLDCSGALWKDQGPNGLDLVQTSSSNQPMFLSKCNTEGPGLRFQGKGMHTMASTASINATVGDCTFILLMSRNASLTGADGVPLQLKESATGGKAHGVGSFNYGLNDLTFGNGFANASDATQRWSTYPNWAKPMALAFTHEGAERAVYKQYAITANFRTASAASGNEPDETTNALSGNIIVKLPGYGGPMDISEIIIYNRLLTQAERFSVITFLAKSYGITLQ